MLGVERGPEAVDHSAKAKPRSRQPERGLSAQQVHSSLRSSLRSEAGSGQPCPWGSRGGAAGLPSASPEAGDYGAVGAVGVLGGPGGPWGSWGALGPPLTQIMYFMILLVATVYSSISSAR